MANTLVQGAENLQAYKKEAFSIKKVDADLKGGDRLKSYVTQSPRVAVQTHGGPVYMAVGEHF